MSSSVKYDKYSYDVENNSSPSTGSLGHKNSLRGTKLARRARSFKDDFLEKISQIRTPTNTLGRSHSPSSPRSKTAKVLLEDVKPIHDLNYHVRQVKHALTHFKDVISKKKLEMLPGNGTVVLESVANVHTALQSYTLNENSSPLISATTQVYLSLGKLIQLCDEVLLSENEEKCASLCTENVTEVVDLVETSVQNLVDLVNEKISKRESHVPFASNSTGSTCNTLQRPSIDVAGQRTSLPDIPLTPRERDLLEQTSTKKIRASHSTESILRDSSPPPKPPLPNRSSNPPPLPPKRKSQKKVHQNSTDFGTENALLSCGLDRMSLRSKSPDDNSSLLSASSLDSALNHSREEEELRALTIDQYFDDQHTKEDIDQFFSHKNANIKGTDVVDSAGPIVSLTEADFKNQRNSNESGFVSLHSLRTSTQSVSTKRSSEQSVDSNKSGILSSEFSLHKTDMSKVGATFMEKTAISQQDKTVASSNIESSSISISQSNVMMKNKSISINNQDSTTINEINLESNTLENLKTPSIDTQDCEEPPPVLPVKTRNRSTRRERHISQYDNVEETDTFSSAANVLSLKNNFQDIRHVTFGVQAKHQSLIEPRNINHFSDSEQPPPLPVKKKHIMAYMEMFGNCSHSAHSSSEFLRHSVHTYNISHSSAEHITQIKNISHSQTMSLSPLHKQVISETTSSSPTNENPPALPPKKQRVNNRTPSNIQTPPPSPKRLNNYESNVCSQCSTDLLPAKLEKPIKSDNNLGSSSSNSSSANEKSTNRGSNDSSGYIQLCDTTELPQTPKVSTNQDDENVEVVLRNNTPSKATDDKLLANTDLPPSNVIEELEISQYLVMKKDKEDGPDVKGGYVDALIVHASRVQKVTENAFGEAFITTFRTFITPMELMEKLIRRYTIFSCQINDQKQKSAKESFSLLVRVVNDLTAPDLTSHILSLLNDFVYQLVCSGQLMMAKLLRIKILEKIMLFKQQKAIPINPTLPSRAIITSPPTLLDLKSADIAEQMTLLDAELFQKIEIPEVLIWAQEQCEERSPNLTKFTEHFNKMSYWARSQILKQEDAKDREKHVIKFIKIMKHLRKINNYNSYLALLSALDSAPIRRLEWHKTITEGLKEYCALIDSSSSFRAYRQALAETNPPCIPYIGLVLQDLTFVHIGNQNYLNGSIINFSKRWQQHNIVVNMKRFRKCSSYSYKKNERIIGFFDNFENYLDEDAMWQISENIKPRVTRKPITNN